MLGPGGAGNRVGTLTGGVDHDFPGVGILGGRQGEFHVFRVGVEAQQKIHVGDVLAARVPLPNAGTVEKLRHTAGPVLVPVLRFHLVAVGADPDDVRQARGTLNPAAGVTVEEPAAPKGGVFPA